MKKTIQNPKIDQLNAPGKEIRHFSKEVRQQIVKEVEKGLSKAEAARKYGVSQTTIYKWIRKYSKAYRPGLIKVVEHASQSNKIKLLEEELIQTLAHVGKLQLKLSYWEELIKKAEKDLGIDLKKNTGL
nr:transposase [Saprospiraceae bacterium]